ncbi:LrgB family protein [Chitinilyticum litopenaei]|uniref:LrgB family protein n=2 Tax=Chitinilyticum piscinae TaxID=2866724 RepID=A0A8J7FY62_9NEIS|nr:LrgB family protein [Chitinilyticum piscinae]
MLLALQTAPFLWLGVTAGCFLLAERLYARTRHFPLLHPVLVSIVLIVAILRLCGVPYQSYFSGAQLFHWLLGTATVALAVPLFDNLQRVRALLWPLLIALLIGGLAGMLSALALGKLFGLSPAVLVSFVPKSVTTPIAMALSQHAGGLPALTANVVILTGIFGAMIAVPLLSLFGVRSDIAQGFALGIAAHGVGTARAMQISPTAGAFAGLAMGLNGVLTSLTLALLLAFWPA